MHNHSPLFQILFNTLPVPMAKSLKNRGNSHSATDNSGKVLSARIQWVSFCKCSYLFGVPLSDKVNPLFECFAGVDICYGNDIEVCSISLYFLSCYLYCSSVCTNQYFCFLLILIFGYIFKHN